MVRVRHETMENFIESIDVIHTIDNELGLLHTGVYRKRPGHTYDNEFEVPPVTAVLQARWSAE